jgi:antitoxin StbD
MNAPFESGPIQLVLAEQCVSISDLKKNPAAVVAAARDRQVAILSRNKPVAYVISPEVWEYLCDLVEDLKDEELVREELARDEEGIEVSLDDLLA